MPRFTATSVLFLIWVIFQSTQALYAPCPHGWMKWHQSCYILLPDKMNWHEASEACNRPGSSLAVPNSPEENDFIWQSWQTQTGGIWIDCTDAAHEGVWRCGGQPAKFTNWWQPDFPSTDGHLNCARITIYYGGVWSDDVPCDTSDLPKYAVCEMLVSTVPTYHTFTGPDGRVPQQCLLHHDIKNLTVGGVLACGWACRADPRCRSFNLWQTNKREKMCQLHDVTRLGADRTDFEAADNCYYFDL